MFTAILLLLSLHVSGINSKKEENAQSFPCLKITANMLHHYYFYWIVLDQLNGLKWRPATTISYQEQI